MVRVWLLGVVAIAACRPAAAKPREKPTDFVDVGSVIPDVVLDLRYATDANFTGKAVYPVAHCKLRRAVVARLTKAAVVLRKRDRRLLVWDCYRPKSIQEAFWKLVPDERYVADPKKGSRHNRGAAVDVTLVGRDGHELAMGTAHDDFSEKARPDSPLVSATARANQRILKGAMEAEGFAQIKDRKSVV